MVILCRRAARRSRRSWSAATTSAACTSGSTSSTPASTAWRPGSSARGACSRRCCSPCSSRPRPCDSLEAEGDYTARLALLEELKTLPFGAVWDHYCRSPGRARRPRLAGGGQDLRARRALEAMIVESSPLGLVACISASRNQQIRASADRGTRDQLVRTGRLRTKDQADVVEADGDQQGVRRRAGPQGGVVRPAGRRGPRAGRRERRGQVDADQGDHRRPPSRRRDDRGPRPAGRGQSTRSARGRWGSRRSTSSRRSSPT